MGAKNINKICANNNINFCDSFGFLFLYVEKTPFGSDIYVFVEQKILDVFCLRIIFLQAF